MEFARRPAPAQSARMLANMAPIMAAGRVPYAQGQCRQLQQDFDFFLVVDFEATCQKDTRIYPQEIIEFPAVLVDGATGRLESAFRRYISPKHHPVLTQFCRDLTGIRQEDVDGGVDLGQALRLHDAWLKAATTGAGTERCGRLAVVTWGDWDCRTMLEFECRFKGIEKPSYFDRWINLRVPFQAALGGGGRVTLQEAVRAAGLDWEGRLHCGMDDARNTARLLVELMLRGVKMSITGSLALPRPIQQQPPHTSPCRGSSALAPPPIRQPPHVSTCGSSSVTFFCYSGWRPQEWCRCLGPMQGKCFFACGNGGRVLLVWSN